MDDNQENILVDFDVNNIIVVDPNKVVDENGRASERLINHENLVMYANLECKVLPRTKLILGSSNTDNVRTISVAEINFLNPGKKTFLDNSYTDDLTGKDILTGKGTNQSNPNSPTKDLKTDEYYLKQSTTTGTADVKTTDNGLLGIRSISVRQNTSFLPTITVKMEDVRGRALFESGDNSPYASFFNLPYPLFHLTLKGYYGKAIKLPLMLKDFTASFNSETANFDVTCEFITYKFNVLSDISMGNVFATPHMYQSNVETKPKVGGPQTNQPTKNSVVELGYEKIREMYSEYKSKGMIPDDFPEITVVQMKNRIDNFIKNILNSFEQQNLDALTNCSKYQTQVGNFRGEVLTYQGSSWFNKYMDTENAFITNDGQKVYTFKKEYNQTKRQDAKNELKKIVEKYNEILNKNETLGNPGSYTINGEKKVVELGNKVNYNDFIVTDLKVEDFELLETYRQRKKITGDVNQTQLDLFRIELEKENIVSNSSIKLEDGQPVLITDYFVFEGLKRFDGIINEMLKSAKDNRNTIEEDLTQALSEQLQNKSNGIGFVPTIRNVLAVLFANGEAFLRLMDDVHTKAWAQKDNKIRKSIIFDAKTNPASSEPSSSGGNAKIPVFPWPQILVSTSGDKGQEYFEVKYPGSPEIIDQTQAYRYDVWPEVEFLEEFIKGLTQRTTSVDYVETSNEESDIKRVSLNAIEYPTSNVIYSNKEETKYFFEIYERLLLYSFFSKMGRTNNNTADSSSISNLIAEIEKTNIIQSLGNNNPFLSEKLKNYPYNSSNILDILKQYSNQGVGESWQNFIRGIFNTSYIKNLVENSEFEIFNIGTNKIQFLGRIIDLFKVNNTISIEGEEKLVEYLTGNSKNQKTFDLTDTFPFTNLSWDKTNMAGVSLLDLSSLNLVSNLNLPIPFASIGDFFQTSKVINYNKNLKVISNFSGQTLNSLAPKPFTSFNYLSLTTPNLLNQKQEFNISKLNDFYLNRVNKPNQQLPTEGTLLYKKHNGKLTDLQTASILNTPYFINSIQDGVKKFRDYNENPYVASAYLFLNSLPIATLREKYKVFNKVSNPNATEPQDNIEDLNYIFATLKKYGAIHKLPLAWTLKMGSIWHRYKKYVEKGEDILNTSWSGFSYINNFDPTTNDTTKDYALTLSGGNVDIILEKNSTLGGQQYTTINTGFYPKLINDFNVFYQGYQVFNGYTSSDIQSGITSGVTIFNVPTSNLTFSNGYDLQNLNRVLRLTPWSVYVDDVSKKYSYLLPSHGSQINQVKDECFVNNLKSVEVTGNTSVYNGSIRLFWAAPNYGYFDVNDIVRPSPSEYMQRILPFTSQQRNFTLQGSQSTYSKIEDIFGVFEKNVLDTFEKKFLDFSKSIYDYKDPLEGSAKSYGNFQMLFTSLMKVPSISDNLSVTNYDRLILLQNSQIINFGNIIKSFLEYDVLIKFGNPSNFDRNLFYSFSNDVNEIVDPWTWEYYSIKTPNALPNTSGVPNLVTSKLNYPNEWKTLETYIGFSQLSGITYTNTGSTITDFFIDFNIAFTEKNIVNFAPIIKIYATQKQTDPNLNPTTFKTKMSEFLVSNETFVGKIVNSLFTKLNKELDNIKINPEKNTKTAIEGETPKEQLWDMFKAINDKWIAGNDFKNKTLFEDVLLLDRASRNVGDIILVDIYKLSELIDPQTLNPKTNLLTVVSSILTENRFQMFNVPAYVNFYNVQDATKNPKPRSDGSTQTANDLFGTFLSVDTRNSSTKMVCFYVGKPSEFLDSPKTQTQRKNDTFSLTQVSNHPLVENLSDKKDWDKSNKVVGFNVDIGPQNQGVFTRFSVSQKSATSTAESLQRISDIANQAGNRTVSTQNQSLLDIYQTRSYTCDISMMGNVMIQPMMYFNLRYVPMFSGSYMITTVNHEIGPGKFETTIQGVRQPTFNLPKITDFLMSLRANLVQAIIDKTAQAKQEQTKDSQGNSISNKNKTASDAKKGKKLTEVQACTPIPKYSDFTVLDTPPQPTTVTIQDMKNRVGVIANKYPVNGSKMAPVVFATMYLWSGTTTGFSALGNNFAGIDINQDWVTLISTYFTSKKYYCLKGQSTLLPYVTFQDVNSQIEFLFAFYNKKINNVSLPNITPESVAKFWAENKDFASKSNTYYSTLDSSVRIDIEAKVKESLNLFGYSNPVPSPTPTPTPTPLPSPATLVIISTSSPTPNTSDASYINIQMLGGTYIIMKINDVNFAVNKIGTTTFKDNSNNIVSSILTPGPNPPSIYQVNGQIPGTYSITVNYYAFGLLNPTVQLSVNFNQ